jgi:hypothetical protein
MSVCDERGWGGGGDVRVRIRVAGQVGEDGGASELLNGIGAAASCE